MLLHVSVIWACLGTWVLLDGSAIDPANAILYEGWPLWVRASLWYSTALVALVAAFVRRWQDFGWLALVIGPAERAIGHIMSLWHYLVPGDPPGTGLSAVVWTILWLVMLSVTVTLAGFDEDTPRVGDVVES